MSEFTNEIDLGREDDLVATASSSSKNSKGQRRKFYPTLYIDGIKNMPSMPKEGCVMVKYRRKRMSVEESADGKETSGVTLEIRKLCLPEYMAEAREMDMENAMKDFAKNSGVDTGDAEPDGDEAEDEDGED